MDSSDRYVLERLEFRLKRLSGLQKSQDAQSEKNRAVVATLNAEVRRSKAALKAEIPKLEKLAAKKVSCCLLLKTLDSILVV